MVNCIILDLKWVKGTNLALKLLLHAMGLRQNFVVGELEHASKMEDGMDMKQYAISVMKQTAYSLCSAIRV